MQKIEFTRIADLSYAVDENSPREEAIEPARIYDTATIDRDGYFESRVDMSGHCATHIDAPCLLYSEGFTTAEIPLEKLTGEAVLIDLSDRKKPGDSVSATDLDLWSREHVEIFDGAIVFLRTGMDRHFGDAIFNQTWIGFDLSAAEYLSDRKIKVIGTDACSIDAPAGHQKNMIPPAHLKFLGAEIPQLEDLKNLDLLPTEFYTVIAPLKLARSSGAPARVFAFYK